MRKKPHDKILRKELKKQHLNTVPKSCPKMKTLFINHEELPLKRH